MAANGVVLPGAPASIPVVALNFTANGGDGYPIKYLDPAAATPNQIPNTQTSNFRYILDNGTLSPPVAITADFTAAATVPANAIGEQKAFSDYVNARYPTRDTAYDVADTPIPLDLRIQQLPARAVDTVLMNEVEQWRQQFFGNPNGAGTEANLSDADADGVLNLFEFAFGTNPKLNTSGNPELVYTGSLSGNGKIGLNGQPILMVEPVPDSVDFRVLFIRRKNYLAAGLTYTPQFSVDLASGWQNSTATPVVLADDGTFQVVSVPYIRFINGRKSRFARIEVSLP